MERTTPRAAADALAASARTALQCIARVEVLSSGWDLSVLNSLRVVSARSTPTGTVLLRRADRTPYLQFKVAIEYAVLFRPNDSNWPPYQAVVFRYMFAAQDLSAREVFAYHLHPTGMSDVRTPHLHLSAARPLALPVRQGSPVADELNLSRLHFPTHHIELAELVHFLIRDLGVGPRRQDWEQVLEGMRQ